MLKKRKLILSLRSFFNSIPLKKLKKNSKSMTTLLLVVFLIISYFCYKTSFFYLMYKIFGFKSYDLMSDALIQQHIDEIQLDCKHEEEARMLVSKYSLIRKYYNLRPFDSEFGWHELPYATIYDLSLVSVSLSRLLKNIRFCSLGNFRAHFESRKLANKTISDMILRKREILNDNDFRLVGSEKMLDSGGIYHAPICLQDLLHTYSSWSTLKTIRKLVNNFNTKKSSDDKKNLLESIVNVTFPVLKSLVSDNADIANEFYARKTSITVIIVPYLNRRQNLVDFLYNMHSFLQRQFLSYMIVVAEQFNSNDPFNKGKLYNAAFRFENYLNSGSN